MTKSELNKEKKRTDLLEAAYKLFITIGFSETTITQIAKKAGVGKGTFYLYFKNKEDIRKTLITQKSNELLNDTLKNLQEYTDKNPNLSVCDKIIFITDYIVTTLSKNMHLLRYISKNLSWGMFSTPFLKAEKSAELVDFRTYTKSMIAKEDVEIENFDLMIYTIIELVNSTCYNIILNGDPVTFSDYKPYLFRCIRLIVNDSIK